MQSGKEFLQWAWSQPRLLMDIPSSGDLSACCPGGLLPTQWQCTLITLLGVLLSEIPMPHFLTLMLLHQLSISPSKT